MLKLAVRGAIGFGLGGLIAFLGLMAPGFFTDRIANHVLSERVGLLGVALILPCCFLGGAVSAFFIGLDKRAVLWTALGFIAPVFVIFVALVARQVMRGNETFLQMISYLAVLTVAFAIVGGIPAKYAGLSLRSILISMVGFGLGFVGGFVFFFGEEPITLIGILLPFIVGGTVLGAELGRSRREETVSQNESGTLDATG